MTYTTPGWKRELTMGVASQLLGKPGGVVANAVQTAALVVEQADQQFGFARAVAQLPPGLDDVTEIPIDEEGNVGVNPFVEAVVSFWTSVRKVAAPQGQEKGGVIRGALKERARCAWLSMKPDEIARARRLAVEVLAQVGDESIELDPSKWRW